MHTSIIWGLGNIPIPGPQPKRLWLSWSEPETFPTIACKVMLMLLVQRLVHWVMRFQRTSKMPFSNKMPCLPHTFAINVCVVMSRTLTPQSPCWETSHSKINKQKILYKDIFRLKMQGSFFFGPWMEVFSFQDKDSMHVLFSHLAFFLYSATHLRKVSKEDFIDH